MPAFALRSLLSRAAARAPGSRTFTLIQHTGAWGWTEIELFRRLAEFLTRTGRPTRLQRAPRFPLRSRFGRPLELPIHESYGFLRDDRSGAFWLMVCEDWVDGSLDLLCKVARDPRCRAILKQQHRAESLPKALRPKVHPWTYTSSFPGKLQPKLPALRREPRTRPGLYFRGKVTHAGRATLLARLAAKGLLATDPTPVPFERYCAEVSRQRLVLGLPGRGNLCHREFEAFGIGTPVLMPRLRNRLHNDLVPDRHYIAVEVDPDRDGPDRAADAIEQRYREVAEDTALLERVAAEAIAWYDANAAIPACLRLTVELLERLGLPAAP